MWRWGRRGRGRKPIPRHISFKPKQISFIPFNEYGEEIVNKPIYITPDELEALKLVYFNRYSQEEAARMMGVSRATLWRSLNSGRMKIAQALAELRPIILTQ